MVRVGIRETLCNKYTMWKESHYLGVLDNQPILYTTVHFYAKRSKLGPKLTDIHSVFLKNAGVE